MTSSSASRSHLGLLFVTVALDLVGFGMVVPMMPLYAETLAVSGHAIAWLLSIYSLMQFFFAPVWGRISDRVGRRPVLIGSIFANAVCLLGFAGSQTYWQLFASRAGAGIATANISVASAYVADVTKAEGRARGMGVIGAAFGLGFVLGPFLAGELSPYGLMVPALVASGLSIINGVVTTLVLPESLPHSKRAKPRDHLPWYQERVSMLLSRPLLWSLLTLVFLQIGGFAMMEMSLSLFCEHRFHMNAAGTGRLLAGVGLVMVVVQGGLVGPVVKRLGERLTIRMALVALSCALAFVPASASMGLGLPGLWAAGIVLAAAQGLLTPSLAGLVSRLAPSDAQGVVLGLSQSASALARATGPAVAGLLLDAYGLDMPLYGAAWIVALAMGVALWRLPDGKPAGSLSPTSP